MANTQTNLQGLVETLRKQVEELTAENKKLQSKIKELESNKTTNSAIDNGLSKNDAANALALKLGAKPPLSNQSDNQQGVENGPSQKDAANALAAKLGAKPRKVINSDNADSGSSQDNKNGDNSVESSDIFKKYEKMLKLGISVHGAIGRMIQDGVDKKTLDAFKAKHEVAGDTQEEEKMVNIEDIGFKKKQIIRISKDIKMKRLHWEPINAANLPDTIWQNVNDENITYDTKQFELFFQMRAIKPVEKLRSNRSNPNSSAKEKISFLSNKRSQQVLIGLRGIGLTNDQIRNGLHKMDETLLTQEMLMKLMDIVPTQDEQTEAEKEIGQNGGGDVNAYCEAEQFFYNLCDFYHLDQRLRLWLFKMQFNEITQTLWEQFKNVQKTCDKVKNSKGLQTLFAIILAFGNHMNVGTKKSDTYGFELKILPQLSTIKSFDNSRSLIMHIYEFCDHHYPKALTVLEELLELLKRSSSTEMEILSRAFEKIKESMKEIQDIISDEVDNYDVNDAFVRAMTQFHNEAQGSMKKFNTTVSTAFISTKQLMKKFVFGTDDQPESIEHLFRILYEFLLSLEQSKEKLIKLEKEKQKKTRQKQDKIDKQARANKMNTLQQNVEKQLAFDEQIEEAKKRFGGHIRERSTFVRTGGDLNSLPENMRRDSTMKTISDMYREKQKEEKAAKYNKCALPSIPDKSPLTTANTIVSSRLPTSTLPLSQPLAEPTKMTSNDLSQKTSSKNQNMSTTKLSNNNSNGPLPMAQPSPIDNNNNNNNNNNISKNNKNDNSNLQPSLAKRLSGSPEKLLPPEKILPPDKNSDKRTSLPVSLDKTSPDKKLPDAPSKNMPSMPTKKLPGLESNNSNGNNNRPLNAPKSNNSNFAPASDDEDEEDDDDERNNNKKKSNETKRLSNKSPTGSSQAKKN